ncbi:heavy metal translocating P-type ATPase [Haloflavibacter putidus]|uniref:P-type Zn(2+) transporter n=1 Tax=Haloflavibacter putidus TaxID=2576776 RepID=A0A507ZFX8_9FLAO|nr:heavy metal translocating P-type ATPase [Haloflavibacter putidus]TQD35403.1 heavy metal translocating P-type ATPase [Haloflavibacter putidus]
MSTKKQEKESHLHGGIFGEYTEIYFSALSGIFLASGFAIAQFTNLEPGYSLICYIISYFFGGYFALLEAVEKIKQGGFEIDFLMLVAAIGAAYLDKWAEGALLLFLFSLGHALEHYALGKAQKSIAALSDLAPNTALLKKDGKVKETPIENLKVDDVILVRPHTKIAADGLVIEGESSVDQSPITGESMPVEKKPFSTKQEEDLHNKKTTSEHHVFSGTINGNHSLEIRITKEAQDSTINRLIRMVEEAQEQKSPTQLLTKKFEIYYVPAVIILVLLLNFAFLIVDETWSESLYRSLVVLVAASPCALAISTPAAVLSGVARAANRGVLIKGGKPLEDLGNLTAIAFDKTGTLTEGKPKLTDVICLNNYTEAKLLKTAISIEKLSDHPLARAVVRDATKKLNLEETSLEITNLEAVQGKGLKATVENESVYIGNLSLYENLKNPVPESVKKQVSALERNGKTTMLIKRGKEFIGILGLMDTPRKTAKSTLLKLKSIGIRKMIMLTGDNQNVADAVAKEIGIANAQGSLLPEEKVAAVKELAKKEKKLAMVGDGVNDAPAMANSTVGIAMGAAGSDVALETADIALMADKLEILPFAIGLSRKTKRIIKQNLWISLGMVAVLIPVSILNLASIGIAVAFHEGSTLLVVLNALRLLGYKKE